MPAAITSTACGRAGSNSVAGISEPAAHRHLMSWVCIGGSWFAADCAAPRSPTITCSVIVANSGSDHYSRAPYPRKEIDMRVTLLFAILAAFGAYSLYVMWDFGYLGIWRAGFTSLASLQILLDLVITC